MRSVKLDGENTVRIQNTPEPVPGQGEVLIETAQSALCGSELHAYRVSGSPVGNAGHEGAGKVIRLGSGVTNLQVGQRVGVSAVAGCGECACCAKGQYTWCRHHRVYSNMHADRFVAAAYACHILDYDIPWEVGVLLSGDGLGVPFHTSTRLRDPSIQTVAVFGMGPIGLGHTLLQTYFGRRIIGVDVSSFRRSYGQKLGASNVIDPKQTDAVERIREICGGIGADVCIEAAGRPETARQCFAAVRTAGTVVFNGEQPALMLSPSEDFIRRDVTAVGCWFCHFQEFEPMLSLYRDGLPVSDLISHTYLLEDADIAFCKFSAGHTAKVILSMQP